MGKFDIVWTKVSWEDFYGSGIAGKTPRWNYGGVLQGNAGG